MKILIAADMEGVTGVTSWSQVDPNHHEYQRFRRLMTGDVNAAIRGAFAGGATSLAVTDGHDGSRNILIEELDPRAVLHSGTPMPLSMVHGVDQGVDGVLFIGYHARIGATPAILDHTWSDERVFSLWLNDRLVGESGLNGAMCGHFSVPVIMVSGDQTLCAEACELFGDIEAVAVKKAIGRMAAECLPPEVTSRMIAEAAQRAVRHLAEGRAPAPFQLSTPIKMVLEFVQSEMADKAIIMPGAERLQDRKIQYMAADMRTAYYAFRTLLALAQK